MKSKIIWIVTAVLFVGLIVGASLLYNKLGEENAPDELIIEMPPAFTTNNSTNANDSVSGKEEIDNENVPDTPATAEPEQGEDTKNSSSGNDDATDEQIIPAPDFTMVDMNGKTIKLSDLRGKPVVLNFWASWCGYCVAEMPDFEEYYKIYGKDVQFVMLNTLTNGETISSGKKFISGTKYTFPVYFDETGDATNNYIGPMGGIPQTFFIDENGNLKGYVPYMISADLLKKGIDLIK